LSHPVFKKSSVPLQGSVRNGKGCKNEMVKNLLKNSSNDEYVSASLKKRKKMSFGM